MTSKPHVRNRSEVQPFNVVGEQIRPLAAGAETGSFEVFLQEGDTGMGPPPHHHAWDEAYFVLDGELEVVLGADSRILRAHEFAFVPAGTVHCYRNRLPTRFLSITSREGASGFFAAMDREVGFPIVDFPKAVAVASRNGVFVPPPPGA